MTGPASAPAGFGPREAALVRLSARLAGRDRAALEEAMAGARDTLDAQEVEEALVQSYLFLGYPTALNALALWREVSARGPTRGTSVPPGEWAARGEAVCRAVYAGQYARLRDNVRALHPEVERWMVEEGYGKVLGRRALDLATRELCVVAILAVDDQPRQLYSHLRGALNVGVPPEVVEAALTEALRAAAEDVARRSRDVWRRVRARTESPRDLA